MILSPDSLWHPTLPTETQAVIRAAYGVLLLLTLAQAWPQRRRFFCTERWGGYAAASAMRDRLQNPTVASMLLVAWMGCAIALVAGVEPIVAALVNVVFARYFFIHMRWNGVLRGMGAPGFMTYWLGAVVLLLELATWAAPAARPTVLFAAQLDFAFIMFSAGLYKLTAGYARNEGMDYGLVNPEWGYWWRRYRRLRPSHPVFTTLNQLAWSTEVVAAILMIVPATRLLGAALILVSFVFIALNIRLGFLCEMVIVATLLFFHDGSFAAAALSRVAVGAPATIPASAIVSLSLSWAAAAYVAFLPLAHAGLFYNFYGKRRLPRFLQRALESYTNAFGIIIWRVFSIDVVNFYILVYRVSADDSDRTLVSKYGWRGGFRYSHVGESITITSLFTTLKYYPSNSGLFIERLLRYATTIPCEPGERLVFEYVSIVKEDDQFVARPIREYLVDPSQRTVDERVLRAESSTSAVHPLSPVHEGFRPGSYAPAPADLAERLPVS